MKLKIVSDGTCYGTKVMTEDGKTIDNVREIVWSARPGELARATISILVSEVEIEVENPNIVEGS